MDTRKAQELIQKHREGTLTREEKKLLDTWYVQYSKEQFLTEDAINTASRRAELFSRLQEEIGYRPVRRLWPRIASAAAVLLILTTAGYFILHKETPPQTATLIKHDVDPGGTKAILTLSNGQKIVLNNQQGTIASQGKTHITLSNGNLNYQASDNTAEELYNTLTVPIGNHRNITLADGTEVNLDAGSSITYPVAFTKTDRKVSITGQAYFKVKHDAVHPFFVKVKDLTVQDVGTEFNINAYEDEGSIKTTLVEGSVKVNTTIIKPGQQAITSNNDIQVKDADIEAVTAWKNNDFLMRDQDLKITMRQIARWYNVKVVYENAPEHLQVYADVSRNRPLSVLLKAIGQAGKVKFKIENQTVTVSQ